MTVVDGAIRDDRPQDSGALSLTTVLRMLGMSIDPLQLVHRFGGSEPMGVQELLRAAKQLEVKARLVRVTVDRLAQTPLPAIACSGDGEFFVLARIADAKVLIQKASTGRPEVLELTAFQEIWDGRLLLVQRRAKLSDLGRRFDLSWFASAVLRYRRILSEVLVASFFLQLFGLVTPLFFQVVIDKVLVHRGLSTLDVLMIGLGTISLFETVLGGVRTYVFSHTTNRIDVELGARLFRHLFALPMAYFESRRVGDSVARVRELENVRQFLTGSALTVAIDVVFTVVFIAVMFAYNGLLTWIVVGSLPLYAILSLVVTPVLRRKLDEKFRRGAENQAFLVEAVTGAETVKAMAVEPQMQRRWEEQLAGYVHASFKAGNLGNVGSQIAGFISKVSTVLLIFFGARLVMNGDLTVGELVAVNMLAGRVSQPVLRLAQVWQDFQQARLSVARIGDILNAQAEPGHDPSRSALPDIRGRISFDQVTFRYAPDRSPAVSSVRLEIAPGQVVGIVGPSGSGKSTLTKLVQRLYVPESGRVLVDGVDLALVDTSWLRRQIGVVLQESMLFNRSIRENIALSDPGMSMRRVIEAAELAGAHEFIVALPQGYDTIIGERGNSLSGGQRQRIAIARALVTNPRILIFDEATSALDLESEQVVQANMRRIAQGRTVLIIAHRLSTVRTADRIITIEGGRVVEDGTHADLVRAGGRYETLHRVQAGVPA